jgi:flagellar motility protein MotE (MotC chaperone)
MMMRDAKSPRLLPALIVTGAVVLGLKGMAFVHDADAAGAEKPKEAAPPVAAEPPAAAPAPETKPDEGQCAPSFAASAGLSPSEVQILQRLGERRESLDGLAAEIETRQEVLAAAERRLEQRLSELQSVEGRIKTMLGQLDEREETQIANLVDVYQRMRAKDAAAVFDGLEDDVLVAVAQRMKQANLAEILGKMQPERARALTKMLAKRPDVAAKLKPPAT